MQTFLPYPDFKQTARCLDNKRLGKQRVEAYQILKALLQGPYKLDGTKTAWYNHPAVQMWKGYEASLKEYLAVMIWEWCKRGFKNTMKIPTDFDTTHKPKWLNNKDFHASHRSNLLRKDPEHYGNFGWDEPNDLPYIWPSKQNKS